MTFKFVENHLHLPSLCMCGSKNQYWVNGTYGCERGHVYARVKKTWIGNAWFWVSNSELLENISQFKEDSEPQSMEETTNE